MPARAALLEQPRRRCPEAVATRSAELRWVDWERYSARQDTRMTLGGFMGTATFAGELDVFMPLLRLGEVVHVGKGTAFGLGRYTLNPGGPDDRGM